MGFASFGAKLNPPKKKRKVAGADVDHEGSGSNNTPLGIRARVGEDIGPGYELGYIGGAGDGEREEWSEGVEAVGGKKGADMDSNGFVEGSGMSTAGTETSRNPPYDEKEHQQYTLVSTSEEEGLLEEARQRGLRKLHQMGQEQSASYRAEAGKRVNDEWDWQALRRGVRDERGDLAFYDGSFVEDPWKHLPRGEVATTRPK